MRILVVETAAVDYQTGTVIDPIVVIDLLFPVLRLILEMRNGVERVNMMSTIYNISSNSIITN